MMIVFTYLPGFVTVVFRGIPMVWRGRHRLLLCWLILKKEALLCILDVANIPKRTGARHMWGSTRIPSKGTLKGLRPYLPAKLPYWTTVRVVRSGPWDAQAVLTAMATATLYATPYLLTTFEPFRLHLLWGRFSITCPHRIYSRWTLANVIQTLACSHRRRFLRRGARDLRTMLPVFLQCRIIGSHFPKDRIKAKNLTGIIEAIRGHNRRSSSLYAMIALPNTNVH
jgi:hypothetical protein